VDRDDRITITGVGLATPLGVDVDEVWQRSARGESAIAAFRRFDATALTCRASAEVPDFDLTSVLRVPKNEKYMTRGVRCAVHAAKAAVADSGLDLTSIDPYRLAVYTGSGQTELESAVFFRAMEYANGVASVDVCDGGRSGGDYARLGGRAARLIDPYFSIRTLSNAGLGLLSVEFGAKGASDNFVQGDIAAALAVAAAVRDLVDRRSDAAIVVGYDALLTAASYLAYQEAGLLSLTAPDCGYRPFDRNRDGLVLGEGAACVVLEREADATARGAAMRGEIIGVGMAMDAGDRHSTSASDAMQRAVIDATRGESVDFVVARGIGTREGDRTEAGVIASLFGDRLPVTALKSQTGYLGAATSLVELVLALSAARAGVVPPIARHHVADEDCRLALISGAPHMLSSSTPAALCLAWSWCGPCTAMAVRAPAAGKADREGAGSSPASL
jgi:3-oxoacyl-[acyl-carrier-protein] synthase II